MNIRRTNQRWVGKLKNPTDQSFEQFSEMYFGIRAGMHLLTKYIFVYHLRTLRKIIQRWAPAADGNNVDTYLKAVRSGIGKDPLEPTEFLYRLVTKMCQVESGYTPTRGTDLSIGFSMLSEKYKSWWVAGFRGESSSKIINSIINSKDEEDEQDKGS